MKYLPSFVLIFLPFCNFAQYTENLQTSRPGQSFCAYTTGKNVFQIQSGFNFNREQWPSTSSTLYGANFQLALRYGLSRSFEIRSTFQLNRDKMNLFDPNEVKNGLSVLNVGLRANLIDGNEGNRSSLGIQLDFDINAVSESFRATSTVPRLYALFQSPLFKNMGLTINLGGKLDGNTREFIEQYTLALSFPVYKKLGGFIENYSQFVQGNFEARFDAGFSYLANKNLAFDLSFGYADSVNELKTGVTELFIDFGVSYRILPKPMRSI